MGAVFQLPEQRARPNGKPRAQGAHLGGGPTCADAHEIFLSEPTPEGEQTLLPGVPPISVRERLERLGQAPLMARRPQKPLDIGLFDLAARNQLDLF